MSLVLSLPVCSIFYFIWKRSLFYLGLFISFLVITLGILGNCWTHWMISPSSEIGMIIGIGLSGAYFSHHVNQLRPKLLRLSYWTSYGICILLAFILVMWPIRVCYYFGIDDKSWISLLAVSIFWSVRNFPLLWTYLLTATGISTLSIDYALQYMGETPYTLAPNEYLEMALYLLCIMGAILIPERPDKRKGEHRQ